MHNYYVLHIDAYLNVQDVPEVEGWIQAIQSQCSLEEGIRADRRIGCANSHLDERGFYMWSLFPCAEFPMCAPVCVLGTWIVPFNFHYVHCNISEPVYNYDLPHLR